MKRYKVTMTRDARRDLDEIYAYISENDSIASADHVFDKLVKVSEGLRTFPE